MVALETGFWIDVDIKIIYVIIAVVMYLISKL